VPCPLATEYNEAIQNLRTSVSDEELRYGEPSLNALGMPSPYAGNFADVYEVRCPRSGNAWAVKCFTKEVPGLRERYREISDHLAKARLPFMVDFQYIEPGIRIRGQWHPFLKMRWVQGLNLNRFVGEYVERPKTLKQLLQLWVKLSTRLRDAHVAHADLQHGNVLLVPAGEGRQLGLKLIDYDGMFVPSLAGSKSAELGHPAYQHPQRLREGTYNGEVDRFSHLAIYSAIQCLIAGGGEFWARFDNSDNLLFREADFADPAASAPFQQAWALPDPDARALVGYLVLATRAPLAQVPLLDEIVSGGQVRPLSREEKKKVETILGGDAKRGRPAMPHARTGASEDLFAARTASLPGEATVQREKGTAWWTSGQALPEVKKPSPPWRTPSPPPPPMLSIADLPPRSKARPPAADLRRAVGAILMPVRQGDRLLGSLAGEGNTILHNAMRIAAVAATIVLIGWVARVWVSLATGIGQGPAVVAVQRLRLLPVGPRTVEVGRPLVVLVSVENAPKWRDKLRFSLGPISPIGAGIDARTGRFTWTPTTIQASGKHEVAVSVQGPEGQRDEVRFTITVPHSALPAPKKIAALVENPSSRKRPSIAPSPPQLPPSQPSPPQPPPSAPSPPPPSIAGTSWAGSDSDGGDWTFSFRPDGRLSYKLKSSAGDGTWKQDGNRVSLEINNNYAAFDGAIAGERMSGTASNVDGLRWTWTFQKQPAASQDPAEISPSSPPAPAEPSPPPPTIAGTTWAGNDSDGSDWTFTFRPDGLLSYKLKSSTGDGTWKQDGNTVSMDVNNKYATFNGTIAGDRMSGAASNVTGHRWTWTFEKQSTASEAPEETPSAPQPRVSRPGPRPSPSIAGTTWTGVDDGDRTTISFHTDGTMRFQTPMGSMVNCTWKQDGATVSMDINKFSEYRGTISGTRMSGTASNVDGKHWTWTVRKRALYLP
jgi:hypothetical protein